MRHFFLPVICGVSCMRDMRAIVIFTLFTSTAVANPATSELCLQLEKISISEVAKGESELQSGFIRTQAECYIRGIGVNQNIIKGKALLSKAYKMGDSESGHILASMNVFQSENINEQKEGIKFLLMEYDQGSKFSAGKLGWAYNAGLGFDKNIEIAFRYYEVAAKGGMTLWQFLVAHAYEQGYYNKKVDLNKVKYWKEYKPKIHTYTYECALAQLYSGELSFPVNNELKQKYINLCNENS